MQSISYININDRFTVIGWYKYGAINGRSVIPENSNDWNIHSVLVLNDVCHIISVTVSLHTKQ